VIEKLFGFSAFCFRALRRFPDLYAGLATDAAIASSMPLPAESIR